MDAVIFVLDAQSTFNDMIRKLAITMHKAYIANPGIQFEIFLHKIDGMSEDYRLGASFVVVGGGMTGS
jgi:Ras-related GTP-binding protein C/D